eukprot:TRINITY_DN22569_c0_g2_i2.p1 TRINITY_DN22569_c0_g2~~TRINITY_DN22569_c0_g2_i2.p1  ORF type:complete len:267 (+),score=52.24 TRINITY_DN22569_c0_g2_i2:87-887(+)
MCIRDRPSPGSASSSRIVDALRRTTVRLQAEQSQSPVQPSPPIRLRDALWLRRGGERAPLSPSSMQPSAPLHENDLADPEPWTPPVTPQEVHDVTRMSDSDEPSPRTLAANEARGVRRVAMPAPMEVVVREGAGAEAMALMRDDKVFSSLEEANGEIQELRKMLWIQVEYQRQIQDHFLGNDRPHRAEAKKAGGGQYGQAAALNPVQEQLEQSRRENLELRETVSELLRENATLKRDASMLRKCLCKVTGSPLAAAAEMQTAYIPS